MTITRPPQPIQIARRDVLVNGAPNQNRSGKAAQGADQRQHSDNAQPRQ